MNGIHTVPAHGAVSERRRGWDAALAAAAAAAVVVLALSAWAWDAGWQPAAVDLDDIARRLEGSALTSDEALDRLHADLERHVKWQPSDVRALVFKARLEMRARRYEQAVETFAKALAGNSTAANDPGVWVEYAEARGMSQGRTLMGEPLALVQKALAIDPNHGPALDLAGSAAWERQDFAGAAAHWKRLLAQIPPGSARYAELAQAIERAQQRARMSLPPVTASGGAGRG